MATDISKNVTRRCPGIVNDDGRALDAKLHEEDGGSLTLKWVGLKRTHEHTFSLQELIEFAEGDGETGEPDEAPEKPQKPKGSGYVSFTTLLSKLHIIPMDVKDRERLVKLVKEIEVHQGWLFDDTNLGWEAYKRKHSEE